LTRKAGISFCIITGGKRPDRMETLIQSIVRMELPNYEVLVCGIFHKDSRIRYFEKREWAVSAKVCKMRNFNAKNSKFDTIIILDDDVEFSPDWWEKIKDEKEFDLLGCRGVDSNGNRWWDWQSIERNSPLAKPKLMAYNEESPDAYISGYFMMMKHSVWEDVKFDENRKNYQQDDIDFCHRLTAKGYLLKIFPDALVIHHVDGRGREVSEKARTEYLLNGKPKNRKEEAEQLIMLGNFKKAIPILKDELKNKKDFYTLYNIAYCYQQIGATANAIRYFFDAIFSDSPTEKQRLASAFLHLGELFIESGKPHLAASSLTSAITLMPKNKKANGLLSSIEKGDKI